MSFFKNIFDKKEEPIRNTNDFWEWFQKNEKTFFQVVKNQKNIEKEFLNKLSEKLNQLKSGYFFLTGMFDDNTAELIITADGNIPNIVFVEELVHSAPSIKGWRFTALKPAMDAKDLYIKMAGYPFNQDNMFFYSNDNEYYPDKIDISVIHQDLNETNRDEIAHGVYIYLDNHLGELDFATNIDDLKIIGPNEAIKELVPIAKLTSFLNWRQKEFIEKYDGNRYNTEEDSYSLLQAELKNGNGLVAAINTTLLDWDRKASHPWICVFTIKYDGSKNNGMPKEDDFGKLQAIEDAIQQELKDENGYLNIGRQTADGEREIYFACKEYRKSSKVLFEVQQKYANEFEIDYEIYKDKYWQSFERFNNN